MHLTMSQIFIYNIKTVTGSGIHCINGIKLFISRNIFTSHSLVPQCTASFVPVIHGRLIVVFLFVFVVSLRHLETYLFKSEDLILLEDI